MLVNPSEDVPEQQKLTLIILHPSHLSGSNGLGKETTNLIQKLATKKGNSERIYRNTILFWVASEAVIGKLSSDVKDYLACQQISADYGTQLERDQKDDLKRKIDEANKSVDSSLVVASSTVVKYSVKNGPELLAIQQFKDSLEAQLNSNFGAALKVEVPVIAPENKSNETIVAPQPSDDEVEKTPDPTGKTTRGFKSITISGKVSLDRYSELFNYFISHLPGVEAGLKFRLVSKSQQQKVIRWRKASNNTNRLKKRLNS